MITDKELLAAMRKAVRGTAWRLTPWQIWHSIAVDHPELKGRIAKLARTTPDIRRELRAPVST